MSLNMRKGFTFSADANENSCNIFMESNLQVHFPLCKGLFSSD